MALSRRHFLQMLVAGGGLAALGGLEPVLKLARAGDDPSGRPHYFIFCYFSGAWDILLSLDPRDPEVFNNERLSDTLIEPGYDQLVAPASGMLPNGGMPFYKDGLFLGPYVGELARHTGKLAIVRGMSMDTLTHEVGRRRFLTGKVPSGLQARGSSVATWLASKLGASELIPNLAGRVEAYNADQPTWATALRVNSVDDLLRALRPGADELSTLTQRQLDELLTEAANCSAAQRSTLLRQAEESRQRTKEMIASEKDALFDFMANTTQMKDLRARYTLPGFTFSMTGPEARSAMAVQAITNGISRCVSLEVTGNGLDTHYVEWTTDQGPNQQRGFDCVARMVDDLASRAHPDGGTWLDYTTLVGFSEFSRTAMLNANNGRDHALTNACFLLGAGIRGATVVGRSSDVGLAPTATNLMSGQEDANGEVIHPEHVMRTLFEIAGITDDVADLRVEPVWALMS